MLNDSPHPYLSLVPIYGESCVLSFKAIDESEQHRLAE